MSLEGKKALVTGGSRGIGRAIALALGRNGAEVAFTYHRHRAEADKTKRLIEEYSRRALELRVDLGSRDSTDQMFDELTMSWEHLDILVSNAAITTSRPALDLNLRNWDTVISTNLTGFFHCAKRSVELMRGSGSIIAISSLGAGRVAPGYAALGVAKAGVEALARYLAVELADKTINVNVVCPGLVRTEALKIFGSAIKDPEAFVEAAVAQTPDGRAVSPDEVAGVVVFLCTPEASRIRGQTIVVDGGYSLTMCQHGREHDAER